MIFKLRFDRFRFLVGDISLDEVKAKMGDYFALDKAIWADIWQPLEIKFTDDSDKKNVIYPPDITCWFTDELILNNKAFQVIGPLLEPYGEFLPASCEGIPYWILHVTKKMGLDIVDLKKSNRVVEEGGFIDIQALVFKTDAIQDLLLFKTEYSGYRNIYCTEKFKKLVEGANLKGLNFSTDLVSIL